MKKKLFLLGYKKNVYKFAIAIKKQYICNAILRKDGSLT